MSTTNLTLIKNETGTYSYGEFFVCSPDYDKSLKKHVFNIIRDGYVPAKHIGNHLTLRNAIKRITEEMEAIRESITETPTIEAEEETKIIVDHEDTPLMSSLKAVINDPTNEETYGIFRMYLDESLTEEEAESELAEV